ncbi:MAG: hypothetical protein H7330_01360 [Hymenobacteraceae bacterium]|nr:hypothetical protein [Hymenobacteraceae bacterium]
MNTRTMVSEKVGEDNYIPAYYSPSPDGQQIAVVEEYPGLPRGLVIRTLRTNQRRLLVPLAEGVTGKSRIGHTQAAWAGEANVIFWTGNCSLFRTDPTTGATTKLRDGCVNSRYEQVAAAPDGSFVIATKYEQRYLGNDSLEVSSTAWKIAGDGSWEERLPK